MTAIAHTRPRRRPAALIAVVALAVVAALGLALWGLRDDGVAVTQEPLPAALQEELDALVADRQVGPGAIAAVLVDGELRVGAAGVAELESGRAATVDDHFRIASITKTYVATAVLQAVAEGRLALGDGLGERLPGVFEGEHATITVRQLLTHSSGLEDMFNSMLPEAERDLAGFYASIDDPGLRRRLQAAVAQIQADPFATVPSHLWVELAAERPLEFSPGGGNSYSNTNYVVLGEILERLEGKPLGTILHERLFAPLGLDDTSYVPGPDLPAPYANGYEPDGADGIPDDDRSRFTIGIAGASSIVADVDDVARFYAALLGGDVVPPQLLETMRIERMGIGGAPMSCGVGYGHDGGWAGYASWARSSGDGSRVAVLFVNGRGRDTGTAGIGVLDELYCTR